jgi:hypothetical protein
VGHPMFQHETWRFLLGCRDVCKFWGDGQIKILSAIFGRSPEIFGPNLGGSKIGFCKLKFSGEFGKFCRILMLKQGSHVDF